MTTTRPPLLYPILLGPAMAAGFVGGVIGLSVVDEIYGPIPLIIGGLIAVLVGTLSALLVRLVAGLVARRAALPRGGHWYDPRCDCASCARGGETSPYGKVRKTLVPMPDVGRLYVVSTDNGLTWTNQDTGEVVDRDEIIRRVAPFLDVEAAEQWLRDHEREGS